MERRPARTEIPPGYRAKEEVNSPAMVERLNPEFPDDLQELNQ